MSITALLGAAIFLLGAAVGELLTRLQWRAFKQKVSQEMLEQLGAEPSIENGPTEFGHPNAATFITPYVDDTHPVAAASPGGEHISSDRVAESTLKWLLEQNQIEIARMLQEVQALWSAIGPSGNDPDRTVQSVRADNSNDRRSLQIKYARWFSPSRALKPH